MAMDSKTANGAATRSGMQSASSGTAISASPKPNAERIRVARKTIARTNKREAWMDVSPGAKIAPKLCLFEDRNGASLFKHNDIAVFPDGLRARFQVEISLVDGRPCPTREGAVNVGWSGCLGRGHTGQTVWPTVNRARGGYVVAAIVEATRTH